MGCTNYCCLKNWHRTVNIHLEQNLKPRSIKRFLSRNVGNWIRLNQFLFGWLIELGLLSPIRHGDFPGANGFFWPSHGWFGRPLLSPGAVEPNASSATLACAKEEYYSGDKKNRFSSGTSTSGPRGTSAGITLLEGEDQKVQWLVLFGYSPASCFCVLFRRVWDILGLKGWVL